MSKLGKGIGKGLLSRKPKSKVYRPQDGEFKYWKRYEEWERMDGTCIEVSKPLTGLKYVGKKPWQYYISEEDPITRGGKMLNREGTKVTMPLVEPVKDWHYYIGDTVEVLVGKDKGKLGRIYQVVRERNWVFVTGLNFKQMPGNTKYRPAPAPLLINHEVKLVDPSDMKQTDIEWRYTDEGDLVRVSTRTARIIPIQEKTATTWEDGVDAKTYKASPKDTTIDDLRQITFQPVNSTFEEDILKKYNLYEPRKKRKTYWY